MVMLPPCGGVVLIEVTGSLAEEGARVSTDIVAIVNSLIDVFK